MPLPSQVTYGTVTGELCDLATGAPMQGQITFTPGVSRILIASATPPVTIITDATSVTLDINGQINSTVGVQLMATNNTNLNPYGWAWTVTFDLSLNGVPATVAPFSFTLPATTTVDLTSVTPVSGTSGTNIVQGATGATGAPGSTYPISWAPTTVYAIGQQVLSPGNDAITCTTAHTSASSYTTGEALNWSDTATYSKVALSGADWLYPPGSPTSNLVAANTVAPTTTSSTGVTTSGTTEIMDTVLGTYVYTAVAGRRYLMKMSGLQVQGSTVGDIFTVNIRNGGAVTPTAASSLVATANIYVASISVGFPVLLECPYLPGAGVVTLGLFITRYSGTGTAVTANPRFLYVTDQGPF